MVTSRVRKSSGYGMVTDVIPPAAESNARSFTSKSLKIAAAATAAAFTVGAITAAGTSTAGAGTTGNATGAGAARAAVVTPAKLVIDVNAHVDVTVEEDVHKVTTPSRYKKEGKREGISGYADTFHASAPLCFML
jgi:hypothetical protein